jgi:hypothetical protein
MRDVITLAVLLGLGAVAGHAIESWWLASHTVNARTAPESVPADAPRAVEREAPEEPSERRTTVTLEPLRQPPAKSAEAAKPLTPKRQKAAARPPEAPPAVASVSAPAPVAHEVPVDSALLDRGQALLADGSFPTIVAHYRTTLGFGRYADTIRTLGGRFFVRDLSAQQLRAEVSFREDRLVPVERAGLGRLSPRVRDLSDEPALERFTRTAERDFGLARYAVILLVPLPLDAAVVGGIERALLAMHRTPAEFTVFEGRYQQRGGDLVLEIDSGRTRAGETVPVAIVLNLSRAVW